MRALAFDLEIVKDIPEGENWHDVRPLGISCAATFYSQDDVPIVWYHGMQNDVPQPGAMTEDELKAMLDYMLNLYSLGNVKPVTWNGLQFDFDVLAEESGMKNECVELALNHYDMMFQIFCTKGYPIGLDKLAKGLGFAGKTEGMTGAKAPEMWAGSEADRWKTLEYVADDAIATMDIYREGLKRKSLSWKSNAGNSQYMGLKSWRTVLDCLEIAAPDNSWMTNPMTRESFFRWTR